MAGIRKRIKRASKRTARGHKILKKLTWRGRKYAIKRSLRRTIASLSPGTARTGRRIAGRYKVQRGLLKYIGK